MSKSDNKIVLLSDDSLAGSEASKNNKDDNTNHEIIELSEIEKDGGKKKHKKSSFVIAATPMEEARKIFNILMLIAFANIFEFGPQIIANIMVGHYYDNATKDDEMLSAIGLSTTFVYITGVAITWGFTTALYTLVPQALGHENETEVNMALRVYFQRAVVVTSVIGAPLLVLQLFSGTIMVAIGEPSYLQTQIEHYTYTMIPYIMGMTYLSIFQRFGQALNMNVFLTSTTLVGMVLAFPLMYILMHLCGFGYLGAGIAQSIITCGMALVSAIAFYKDYKFLFKPLPFNIVASKDAIKEYIALSVPGLVQNGFEWWVLEIAIVLAGYIGESDDSEERTTAISGAVIMYNLFLISISFGYGIGNAVNIRVAKYVGHGSEIFAKQAANAGFWVSLGICALFAIVLGSCANYIPIIWTHNAETDRLATVLCYVFIFFAVFLLASQYYGGLYRGCGNQKTSAKFVVLGYYGICLPSLIVILFGFKVRRELEVGSMTIWFGLGAGNMVASILCAIYFKKNITWEDAMHDSHQRLKRTIDSTSGSIDIKDDISKDSNVDGYQSISEDDSKL